MLAAPAPALLLLLLLLFLKVAAAAETRLAPKSCEQTWPPDLQTPAGAGLAACSGENLQAATPKKAQCEDSNTVRERVLGGTGLTLMAFRRLNSFYYVAERTKFRAVRVWWGRFCHYSPFDSVENAS
jgi:hypothetical protein